MSYEKEHDYDYSEPKVVHTHNWCKYGKPDIVGRPGRLVRGELGYIGNSSMAPRKDHRGKRKTLRTHRKGGK
jgi:hypothetical protein